VNAIFEKLADEQAEGYGAKEVHGIIWACLKGRKEQMVIHGKGSGGHSVVANVLNQHLQASAVMKSEYVKGNAELNRQIDLLKKEMKQVSKRANQALTASQRK
jgi:isopentenyl phosphate kinase